MKPVRLQAWSRKADGRVRPKRVIEGYNTGLERGHGIFVDTVNNEVVATSELAGAIYVFSRETNGDVAPLRKIQGKKTQLVYPVNVFVDAVNDEIAVVEKGDKSLLFFPRTVNGDVAPVRVIKGPTTGLVEPYGIWIDKDQIWVTNSTPFWKHKTEKPSEYEKQNSPAILVYPRHANGDVKPIRRNLW